MKKVSGKYILGLYGVVIILTYLLMKASAAVSVEILSFTFVALTIFLVIAHTIVFVLLRIKIDRNLEMEDFNPTYRVYCIGRNLYVDHNSGKIAVVNSLNPFQSHIVSVDMLTELVVNDHMFGSGMMRGTSKVSFEFYLDGNIERFYTLKSRYKLRPKDKAVQGAIQSANEAVIAINEAQHPNRILPQ